jgi:UDP-glucose 4-epimerase
VRPDAVIHMAGLLGTSETFDHPQATIRTNVIGTVNVLEACRDRPDVPFVGVQTGTPWLSPYAISKRAATDLARGYQRAFGIRTTVMKVFNAYGPRQDGTGPVNKIVPRFAVNALRGEPLPIFGDGSQVIDLVHAEDCAEAFVRAVEMAPGRGEVIEVGSGTPITVLEVARRVIDIVGRGELRFLPPRLGEGPEYPVADTALARDLLGFVPQARLDRLPATVGWYREREARREEVSSPRTL